MTTACGVRNLSAVSGYVGLPTVRGVTETWDVLTYCHAWLRLYTLQCVSSAI